MQLDTDSEMQLSPMNVTFPRTPEGLALLGNPYSAVHSPSGMCFSSNLSVIDGVSPIQQTDTHHMSTMLDSILASTNDNVYRSSPLTERGGTPLSCELYLAEWYNCVADLLPPVFRDITVDMPELPPLRDAVLAISAAYLAHLESLIVRTTFRTRKTRYIPQKDHQLQSLQFYNRGIQGIRCCLETPRQADPLHLLAALLLFYYFELDSGSFNGGIGHMAVIDKFLASSHKDIDSSLTGRKLLRTWMNLRSLFVNRYLGGHRSSRPSNNIDAFPLGRVASDEESDYDSITIMMCDSKLVSRRVILDWCVVRGECRSVGKGAPVDDILAQMSLPTSREESISQLEAIDDSYTASLEKQQSRLDKWHSRLSLSDLPIDSYAAQRQPSVAHATVELDIRPLQFHTFEAAMSYAYYAHAQMLCSHDMLNRLKSPTFVEPACTRADCPWVELILRIAAGLDIADCIYKSTFSTGILTILTTCIVVCPRADVASWIEEWIRKVEDFGVPLENGLPFGLTKRIVRFILNQRRHQRDILLILPLDIEDAEKSDLYHSDFRLQVVACGKDMHTGKLYHETLEIPEV